jgi:hypothetical protein
MIPTVSLYFYNIFEASFPVKYKSIHRNKNGWITQGIKISCEHKGRLYTHTHSSDSNDATIKAFYMKYCKIVKVILEVKNSIVINRLIARSDDKIKR